MPDPTGEYTREGLLEVINALPMAILVFGRNQKILLANKSSEIFTGKDIDRLAGLTLGAAFGCINHQKDARGCGFSEDCLQCLFKESLEQALKHGTPRNMVEIKKVLNSKGQRIFRLATQPLKLANQVVALLSIEDLTQERAHEQVRLEKEKLATALETTGGVCHELSQPLQVIMGYCEILGEKKNLDGDISAALSAIQKEVDKLARLTHDLTNITRYETKPYLKAKIIDIEKSAKE